MANIGVFGATGALGKELLHVLNEVSWRPESISAYAGLTTTTAYVEYGGEQVPVDDVRDADFGSMDAAILALPREVARGIGEQLMEEGVPTIDCSGAFAAERDLPVVIPWVNPEALYQIGRRALINIPSAPSILIASILNPLFRAGIFGEVQATVLVPASSFGKKAMEELSQQVIALFNQGVPQKRIFSHGLAFDLLPQIGETKNEKGFTHWEEQIFWELNQVLPVSAQLRPTLVGVPVFSGMSVNLSLRTNQALDVSLLNQLWKDGGLQVSGSEIRQLPRPRKVDGSPFVHVGRVRHDPESDTWYMWAAMDNLRSCAAVAVSACAALLKQVN